MDRIRNIFRFLAVFIILQSPVMAVAQGYLTSEQLSSVATINQDRLFSESLFGINFNKMSQEDANRLAEENRRIEKELADEEIALTQKRKKLSSEEFRKLAAVFNEKVETIRRDQAQKLNVINASRIQAQRAFFLKARPVIIDLMRERGILFILNDQAVFMSGSSGDITKSAIERIDQVYGSDISFGQQ